MSQLNSQLVPLVLDGQTHKMSVSLCLILTVTLSLCRLQWPAVGGGRAGRGHRDGSDLHRTEERRTQAGSVCQRHYQVRASCLAPCILHLLLHWIHPPPSCYFLISILYPPFHVTALLSFSFLSGQPTGSCTRRTKWIHHNFIHVWSKMYSCWVFLCIWRQKSLQYPNNSMPISNQLYISTACFTKWAAGAEDWAAIAGW